MTGSAWRSAADRFRGETPDAILKVFDDQDVCCYVDPADEAMIRQARHLVISGGGDRLLTLTTMGGATWEVPASRITAVLATTRASREQDSAIVVRLERECHLVRQSIWPDAPG